MLEDLYSGELVRLAALDPAKDAEEMTAWGRDSGYSRMLDSSPPRLWSVKRVQEWWEKQQKAEAFSEIEFAIRTLDGDKLIGSAGLDGISWQDRNSWVGIGIGIRDYWGRGYGTDAMRILARYAFEVLDLQRLTLNVFGYNTRAVRSYEKVGYKIEGRFPQALHREGQRYDMIFMGLLREDWQELNP